MKTWIKLSRDIINSAVFEDAEVLKVWIWLLCSVAHTEHQTVFQGKVLTLKEGEIITGRKKMASEIGLSESRIMRAIKILKQLGNIDVETTNKYSKVNIKKWAIYQGKSAVFELSLTTNEQQTNNKTTTNEQQTYSKLTQHKNDKNVKNEKNDKNERERVGEAPYALGKYANVFVTPEELATVPNQAEAVEILSEYLHGLTQPYKKKHIVALTGWVQEAIRERKSKKAEPEQFPCSFEVDEFFNAALKKSGYE